MSILCFTVCFFVFFFVLLFVLFIFFDSFVRVFASFLFTAWGVL